MANVAELDARLLGRPPRFGGSEAEWQDWSFQARAYLDTLSPTTGEAIEGAETAGRPVPARGLRVEHQEASRKIFYVLAMLLHGPPLLLLRSVERGNGLEAWRLLKDRYESATASRLHAMLGKIMRPDRFPEGAQSFESALQDWELLVHRWENMANDVLNDSVKRQILLEQSPASIRMQLTLAGHPDYRTLKQALMEYLMNSTDWSDHIQNSTNNGATPMEVDAITQSRKPDEKGDRTCYNCGKQGHLSRDCWSPPQQQQQAQKGKGKSKGKTKGKGKGKFKGKGKGQGTVNSVDGNYGDEAGWWDQYGWEEQGWDEWGWEVQSAAATAASVQLAMAAAVPHLQLQVPPVTQGQLRWPRGRPGHRRPVPCLLPILRWRQSSTARAGC